MIDALDTRLVAFAVWGVGAVLTWGIVLVRRRRHYKRHRDARASRDFTEAVGLFVAALAACVAVLAALFSPGPESIAGLLSSVAMGVFLIVGVYAAMERYPDDPGTAARRK